MRARAMQQTTEDSRHEEEEAEGKGEEKKEEKEKRDKRDGKSDGRKERKRDEKNVRARRKMRERNQAREKRRGKGLASGTLATTKAPRVRVIEVTCDIIDGYVGDEVDSLSRLLLLLLMHLMQVALLLRSRQGQATGARSGTLRQDHRWHRGGGSGGGGRRRRGRFREGSRRRHDASIVVEDRRGCLTLALPCPRSHSGPRVSRRIDRRTDRQTAGQDSLHLSRTLFPRAHALLLGGTPTLFYVLPFGFSLVPSFSFAPRDSVPW